MSLIELRLPLRFQITPMSGLMVAWFLIGLLVFLLLELGSLLTSLSIFGSDRRWGHVDLVRPEGDVQSCRGSWASSVCPKS